MRIINEQGRLFGKINIIDFIVLVFIFIALPAVYFGYKLYSDKTAKAQVTKTGEEFIMSADVCVLFRNLSLATSALVSAGDKEYDANGQIIGEILDVIKVEPNFITIKFSETDIITKEDPQRKQALVKLRIKGKLIGNDLLYKGSPVKFGYGISFNTSEYEIDGIFAPEPSNKVDEFRKSGLDFLIVDVNFMNLSPETAASIAPGDLEYDAKGGTIARVLSIGSIEPYTHKIDMGDGNYITKIDPQNKQVQVKLEILGEINGNAFYFRGKRIALDSRIELNTGKYKVEGIIIREPVPVKSTAKVPITLDILFTDLNEGTIGSIAVNDSEIDQNGDTIAKILSIGEMGPYVQKIDLGGGDFITKTDPVKKQLQVKMEVLGKVNGNAFYFRNRRIAIDSQIEFDTGKYMVEGVIVREPVSVKKIDIRMVMFKLKCSNLLPELVAAVKKGDEEIDYITGELISRVEAIESIEDSPYSQFIAKGDRQLLLVPNHTTKDIVLIVMASCSNTQKGLLFKETPVKIGTFVSIQTKNYDVFGQVIAIKEVKQE